MELLFHDCEPDIARWAISQLRNHQSPAHMFDVFPLQSLPDVEYKYIVCGDDQFPLHGRATLHASAWEWMR